MRPGATSRPSTEGDAPQRKRARNAQATREAILRSALVAFSRYGYDGVGIRKIAEDAGVTGTMVSRYFGSKEKLFTMAAEKIFTEGGLLSADPADLSRQAAQAILEERSPETPAADPFLLMLRSSASSRATEILSNSLDRHLQKPLAAALTSEQSRDRAMMSLGLIAGFRLMYSVIGARPPIEADRERLAARLEPLFRLFALSE